MRRRGFLRRLAVGVAALYSSPRLLESLAVSDPVVSATAALDRILRDSYLDGIIHSVVTEADLLALFADEAKFAPPGGRYIETREMFTFPTLS